MTPAGRAYLAAHPGIDWRAPDPGGESPSEIGKKGAAARHQRPAVVAEPTTVAACVPLLHMANAAICPPCGSENVLHVFGQLHVCRDCRARFEVNPARSGA